VNQSGHLIVKALGLGIGFGNLPFQFFCFHFFFSNCRCSNFSILNLGYSFPIFCYFQLANGDPVNSLQLLPLQFSLELDYGNEFGGLDVPDLLNILFCL